MLICACRLFCAPLVLDSNGVIAGASFMTYANMDNATLAFKLAKQFGFTKCI